MYGLEPPEIQAFSVVDCPTSIELGEKLIPVTEGSAFIVKYAFPDDP